MQYPSAGSLRFSAELPDIGTGSKRLLNDWKFLAACWSDCVRLGSVLATEDTAFVESATAVDEVVVLITNVSKELSPYSRSVVYSMNQIAYCYTRQYVQCKEMINMFE